MAMRRTLLFLVVAVGASSARADITVIQPPPNASRIVSTFTEGGFSLSAPDGFWVSNTDNGHGSVWYPSDNPYYLGEDAFDAASIHYDVPTITLVYGNGNSPFSALSIDLAQEYNWEPGFPTVSFIGRHLDGSLTTDTVMVDTSDRFETFNLPGMTDIISLTWNQGPTPSQFTNVTVVSAPEPPALRTTTIIAAVAVAAVTMRRRRRATSRRLPHHPGESTDS